MTRSELVDRLALKMPTRSKKEVEKIVCTIFEEISASLESGKRVEIRGFGSFFTKKRKERMGIDPRDGRTIHVEAHHVPAFRAGRIMLKALNG